jgi:hypothetical protein
MIAMPSCPVCKTNEFVVSDGGFKQITGTLRGAGQCGDGTRQGASHESAAKA